jgi:hypothetical protein
MPSQRRTINEFIKIENDIKNLRNEFKEIRELINNLRKIIISDKMRTNDDFLKEYIKIEDPNYD